MTLEKSQESKKRRLFESKEWKMFESSTFLPTRRGIADKLDTSAFILSVSAPGLKTFTLYAHKSMIRKWGEFVKLEYIFPHTKDPDSIGMILWFSKTNAPHYNLLSGAGQQKQSRRTGWKREKWPFKWPTKGRYQLIEMEDTPFDNIVEIQLNFRRNITL